MQPFLHVCQCISDVRIADATLPCVFMSALAYVDNSQVTSSRHVLPEGFSEVGYSRAQEDRREGRNGRGTVGNGCLLR